MLPFEESIVSELLDDPTGGLVVLASGLPLHSIAAALVNLHHHAQGSLLLLSASDSQRAAVLRSLRCRHSSDNPNPSLNALPTDIPGDLPSHHRAALYSSGAALFVTPRILIADLLTSRAPAANLAGLIIFNAHRISDTSAEAFAARLIISGNPSAYIRAISDRPHAISSGFAKAERIMKCLYIKRLHLWPRFELRVSADLEKSPPEVIDVRIPLSPLMKGIQVAIIEAMGACLKELRRTNKVDVEDLTVENGLFKSFDEIVRRQLDPIWHTLGKKTKQLVTDLKTLRKLLDYLVRYDAVNYLKYLDTLRVSEGVRSVWIFADSSQKIFEYAKRRVYQVVTADGVKVIKHGTNKKRRSSDDTKKEKEVDQGDTNYKEAGRRGVHVFLEEVLEEAPKWKVLRELLEEIEEDRKKHDMSIDRHVQVEDTLQDSDIVLVACKDERSCLQLEDAIKKGPHEVMRAEWGKYLLGKVELHSLRKRIKKKSLDPKGLGVLDGKVAGGTREDAEPSSISKLENDALLAAASKIQDISMEENIVGDVPQPRRSQRASAKLKARPSRASRKASSSGNKGKKPAEIVEDTTVLERKIQECVPSTSEVESLQEKTVTGASLDRVSVEQHVDDLDTARVVHPKPIPPVQFYALDSNQHMLDVWKPSIIIVYHPDMQFIRQIEVYRAENPLRKLKVYFLFYEDSTEVQKFEASIRRENGAFESLIRQKSLMMIPVDQNGRCSGLTASREPLSLVSQNSVTRKAGGRKLPEKHMQVIVDMREFMSSLPNVLHQKGMKIVPVTLEVGDYVLSPLICVERKSIMDLYQSFASGRLYHQVETMVRYYKIPLLLIEFSQDKSFSFQSASDIGDDVSPTNIISKLSLLVLHFPRLRLVWSRSIHATAEIFASLKSNQDEPDESKAIRVGVPSEDGVVEDDVRAENFNTSAIEFLRRLPGVTDSNYRAIMDGCNNLAELAELPVERLAELMGGQKSARTLKEFLDAKFPTLL